MESRSFHLHDGKKGSALTVRVVPRARKNEIVEIMNDGTVKIRLQVSQDNKRINQELIEFLAQVLEAPKNRLEVVAGANGPDKLISVLDLDTDTVQNRILSKLS